MTDKNTLEKVVDMIVNEYFYVAGRSANFTDQQARPFIKGLIYRVLTSPDMITVLIGHHE